VQSTVTFESARSRTSTRLRPASTTTPFRSSPRRGRVRDPRSVNKLLVINREITPGRITVVLVDAVLGF
jgi:hypothetical protein